MNKVYVNIYYSFFFILEKQLLFMCDVDEFEM